MVLVVIVAPVAAVIFAAAVAVRSGCNIDGGCRSSSGGVGGGGGCSSSSSSSSSSYYVQIYYYVPVYIIGSWTLTTMLHNLGYRLKERITEIVCIILKNMSLYLMYTDFAPVLLVSWCRCY